MLAEWFQSETFRLLIVLGFFAAGATYVMRRPARPAPESGKDGPMAAQIAALSTENAKLRSEVERLEYTVDKVLAENRTLRGKIERLEHDLAGLTLLLRMNGVDIENLRNVIDSNARHAASGE